MVRIVNKNLISRDVNNIPFIYDIYTKNISFLSVSRDLKILGIKNNKFFLKLYDTSLIGVDPYSPNLTNEQIARITNECVRNPWYFIREVSRIPDEGGANGPGSGMKFQLNRANLAMIWCFLHHIDFYLVIPRQTGKTQSAIAILLWAYLFGTTNSQFTFLNKSQEDCNNNLSRFKAQKDRLPMWMQQKYAFIDGVFKESKGLDNVKTLSSTTTKNKIICKTTSKTIAGAEKVGRGNTTPLQLYDEVEFTDHIGYIIKAAGPAYISASRAAKNSGGAYCRMLITTPGNTDTDPVREILPILNQTAKFRDNMYDWNETEIADNVSKISDISMMYIEFNYRQVGKDEEWYQQMCKSLGNDVVTIKRELLLYRIKGSSNSPFDPEDLDIINSFGKEPISTITIDKYFFLDIYEKLDIDKIYFVGVDCATGTAGDNNAVTVVDPYTLKPVAEFKSPFQGTIELSKFIRKLRRMIPKAIICVERNSVGSAVLEMLAESEVYPNLYSDPDKLGKSNVDEIYDNKGFLRHEANKRRSFGVYTDNQTRELMMNILCRHVAEYKDRFVSKNVIDDVNNLVRSKSGKIQAASGAHDDSIMSYLIALLVYYHGKKLHRYGFIRGMNGDIREPAHKEPTYKDFYNQLPDDLKQVFAPPARDINKEVENELYRAILEQQALNQVYTVDHATIKANNNPGDNIDYEYESNNVDEYFDDDSMADLIGELND